MAYSAPTSAELRFIIQMYWKRDRDPARKALAEDREFLDLKIQGTQQLMRDLIHSGLPPLEAERQAIRQVALAE
jgi:hypothetical protein